jgi:hypothetical protein
MKRPLEPELSNAWLERLEWMLQTEASFALTGPRLLEALPALKTPGSKEATLCVERRRIPEMEEGCQHHALTLASLIGGEPSSNRIAGADTPHHLLGVRIQQVLAFVSSTSMEATLCALYLQANSLPVWSSISVCASRPLVVIHLS